MRCKRFRISGIEEEKGGAALLMGLHVSLRPLTVSLVSANVMTTRISVSDSMHGRFRVESQDGT